MHSLDRYCAACGLPRNPAPPEWAIVHLLGHTTLAGRVFDLGHGWRRLEVPAVGAAPARALDFGPGSVHRVEWCDEATARARMEPVTAVESDAHGHRWWTAQVGTVCCATGCSARRGWAGSDAPCPATKPPGDGSAVGPDEVGPDGLCRDGCGRRVGEWHAAGCAADEIPF